MRKVLAALALMLVVPIGVCAQTTGGVRGYVHLRSFNKLDAAAKPIAGATVRITGASADETVTTDQRGFFVVFGLPPGPYQVYADAPDYTMSSFSFSQVCIHAGTVDEVSLALLPEIKIDWHFTEQYYLQRYRPSTTQTADLYSLGYC